MSLDAFEDRLLRAGRAERPSRSQSTAAKAALMGAAFGATAAATTPAQASVAAKTFGGGLKLLAAVAIVGGGVALSARVVTPTIAAPMSAPSARVFERPAVTTTPPTPDAPTPVESLPVVAVVVPRATPRAEAPDVAEEARLIAAARDCNASDDLVCSGEELDAYKKRFPHGQLASEAELVSIDRQRRAGDVEGARARLHHFLEVQPNHPFAKSLAKRMGTP